MTDTAAYQPSDAPPTAILRALAGAVQGASEPGSSLKTAQELLAQATPGSDRIALRLIALWLLADPAAAERLRSTGAIPTASTP